MRRDRSADQADVLQGTLDMLVLRAVVAPMPRPSVRMMMEATRDVPRGQFLHGQPQLVVQIAIEMRGSEQ